MKLITIPTAIIAKGILSFIFSPIIIRLITITEIPPTSLNSGILSLESNCVPKPAASMAISVANNPASNAVSTLSLKVPSSNSEVINPVGPIIKLNVKKGKFSILKSPANATKDMPPVIAGKLSMKANLFS